MGNGVVTMKLAILLCILLALAGIATAENISAGNFSTLPVGPESGQAELPFGDVMVQVNETGPGTCSNVSPSGGLGPFVPGNTTMEDPVDTGNSTKEMILVQEDTSGTTGLPVVMDESQVPEAGGTGTLITTGNNGFDKSRPEISGSRIVWEQLDPNNYNIYLYDLLTGNLSLISPGTENSDQTHPAISGDRIVFEDTRNGKTDIYLYDISTGNTSRLTDDTGNQKTPDISGDFVVWQDERDGNYLVRLYNIQSGLVKTVSENISYQQFPSISGDLVVWEDWRNGNYDMYCYRITSGNERQVTSSPDDEKSPDSYGDRVVYEVLKDGYSNIRMFNLTTGEDTAITNSSWDHLQPRISGDLVVWEDHREYFDIYGYNLALQAYTFLTPGNPFDASMSPQVDGNRIVWADTRDIISEVYLLTLGTEKSPLTSGFTANINKGPPPLPVCFTDLSTGDIETWTWDFGDGTISREQNPNHTYQEHGLYSVRLTVSNPYQRNATSITGFIAAGSSPSADFSVNATSGPAPVSIRFTDTSTGYPDRWKWDFGDGSGSEEQDPVHVYTVPGSYTVNLTVNNTFGSCTKTRPSLVTTVQNVQVTRGFDIPGLRLSEDGQVQHIQLNTAEMGEYQVIDPTDGTRIGVTCPAPSGIQEIVIYPDTHGFSIDGSIISGNGAGMRISGAVTGTGLPGTSQLGGSFSYDAGTDRVTRNATFTTQVWDGVLPDDYKKYEQLILSSGYAGIGGSAFTVRFVDENQVLDGPAVVTMSVSTGWVKEFGQRQGTRPEEDTVKILRIGDDGTAGVLNTTFAGLDPTAKTEYFRAESPGGLSSFTLATLTGTGNPLQMAYLSVSNRVGGAGGGGGYGGSGNPTPSPVTEEQKSQPAKTEAPSEEQPTGASMPTPPGPAPRIQETPPAPTGLPGEQQQAGAPVDAIAATSQAPGTSIFTLVMQGGAMVSVVLIVVVSVYARYRKQD